MQTKYQCVISLHILFLIIISTTSCATFLNHCSQWTLSLCYNGGSGHHPMWSTCTTTVAIKPIRWLMYDWSSVPRYATWHSTPATISRLPVLGPLSHQGPLILTCCCSVSVSLEPAPLFCGQIKSLSGSADNSNNNYNHKQQDIFISSNSHRNTVVLEKHYNFGKPGFLLLALFCSFLDM